MGLVGRLRRLGPQSSTSMEEEGATCASPAKRRGRIARIRSFWLPLALVACVNGGVDCSSFDEDSIRALKDFVPFKGYKGDITPLQKLFLPIGPCKLLINEPCGNNDDVNFYLYTSRDQGRTYTRKKLRYPVTKKVIRNSGFDPSLPTKVIIHGYGGGYTDDFIVQGLRDAYIQNGGDVNIINMDWGKLSRAPCYPSAVINSLQGGHCLAQFLESLSHTSGLDIENVHAVGLSLGSHLAAFASNDLSDGKKLGRITGLDPALPFFASLRRSWKLDPGDAHFVDVIHTNAGVFGKIESCGHVDFYVNGGKYQPACAEANNAQLCSHVLSAYYFAESVDKNSVGFYGMPCPSYFLYIVGFCTPNQSIMAQMGEYCSPRTRGVYILSTAEQAPFALGRPLTSVFRSGGTKTFAKEQSSDRTKGKDRLKSASFRGYIFQYSPACLKGCIGCDCPHYLEESDPINDQRNVAKFF